jgi:hypothetical protein
MNSVEACWERCRVIRDDQVAGSSEADELPAARVSQLAGSIDA